MIRTVIQAGDAAQSKRTVEFEEKDILSKELVEPPGSQPKAGEAPSAPPDLIVTLAAGLMYTITEPEVIEALWKDEDKKEKPEKGPGSGKPGEGRPPQKG